MLARGRVVTSLLFAKEERGSHYASVLGSVATEEQLQVCRLEVLAAGAIAFASVVVGGSGSREKKER